MNKLVRWTCVLACAVMIAAVDSRQVAAQGFNLNDLKKQVTNQQQNNQSNQNNDDDDENSSGNQGNRKSKSGNQSNDSDGNQFQQFFPGGGAVPGGYCCVSC